jgi:hypothetical protein
VLSIRDDRLQGVQQALEARHARPDGPLGVHGELLHALVGRVRRIPERDRIRRVDQDGQAEIPGCGPQPGEARVVGQHELAVRVAHAEPEVLPHLQAARPGACRRLQARHQPLRPVDVGPVDMAEREEAPGVRAVVALEVGLELGTPAAVEVHDGLEVQLLHQREQRGDVLDHPAAARPHPLREPATEVVVRVDRAHGGPLDPCLGHAHLGPRPVVGKGNARRHPPVVL